MEQTREEEILGFSLSSSLPQSEANAKVLAAVSAACPELAAQSVGAKIRVEVKSDTAEDVLKQIPHFLANVCFSVLLQRQQSLLKQEKPPPERYAHMNISASRFHLCQHAKNGQVLELDVLVEPSRMPNDRYSSEELVTTISHAVSAKHSSIINDQFQLLACLWPWSMRDDRDRLDRESWQVEVSKRIRNSVFFVPIFTERYLNACAASNTAAWRSSAAMEMRLALSLKPSSLIVPIILTADLSWAGLDQRLQEILREGYLMRLSRGSMESELDQLHGYLIRKLPEEKKQETSDSDREKAPPYLDFLH
eukprot:763043-Hanusia_phi.AAC.2